MKDRSDLEPVRISYLFAITAIALSSIIFLFKEYSAPKNWWAAFYGYDIEVSPRVGRAYNSDIHAQLQQWFLDNGDPEKFSLLRWKYRFLHRSDAVLFKMVWG